MARNGVAASLAAAAVAMVAACARQEAPPGGPEDLRPPVIVRTVPEAFAVVNEIDEVRFDFDERISERVTGGTLNDAVTISPRSGAVRVGKGRRSLSVRPEGGFQPGLVYRVTVRPVVADMFGNRLGDPFELVFSTGGELVATTLAGEVWDRVTGGPVSDATVYAATGDGLVHASSTDRRGIFALRYAPEGSVTVTAFDDANRNGEVDSTEVQGGTTALLAAGDTVLVDFFVLEPDTSAANLISAEALDSVTVTLTFDDFLDPDWDVEEADIAVSAETGPAPAVLQRWQEADYAAGVRATADSLARLDSLRLTPPPAPDPGAALPAPDSAAAPAAPDSAAAPPDTVGIEVPGAELIEAPPARAARGPTPLPPLQGSSAGPTPDGRRVLPGRRVVLLLDTPLPFDLPFEVTVDGVMNLVGLPGGGGTAELVRVPPPPDSIAADSTGIPDSAAVADTGAVPDTGVVR